MVSKIPKILTVICDIFPLGKYIAVGERNQLWFFPLDSGEIISGFACSVVETTKSIPTSGVKSQQVSPTFSSQSTAVVPTIKSIRQKKAI